MVMNETSKDQETSSEQGNAGRRRLVRGAMALAPLVLTLRSGALAAASCTSVRLVNVDNQGRIDNPLPTDVSCINQRVDSCSSESVNTKVPTQSYDLVAVQRQEIGSSGKYNYYCGDPSNPIVNRQVAILSSAGNTSIINLGK
jgi:hypothetical protein